MVLKNEDYKPLWYFSVQIDHIIEARRTHVVARQNWGYGAGKDRKISRSSQGAAENLECKSAVTQLVAGSLDALPKNLRKG